MRTSSLHPWTGKGIGLALALVLLAIVSVGDAGPRAATMRDGSAAYFLSATQVISWDETVGMLDTRTGAIYRLRGNLEKTSIRNNWEQRVPAVTGPHSGMLEIQRATFNHPEATFLVDVVEGHTWILKRTASTNRRWQRVEIFR